MSKLNFVRIFAAVVLALLSTLSGARAQAVYCLEDNSNAGACDYISFMGDLIVMDNPTSSTCAAHGINYGNVYSFVYRFTLSPSVISDAIAIFVNNHGASQMRSTQSPNFSLNGTNTTTWTFINSYANSNTLSPSSSNLNIQQVVGGPVTSASQGIKIIQGSSINNFLSWSDCNLTNVKAQATRKPF